MWQLVVKGLVSGAIVVLANEAARRSTSLAAVLVSLPLTSILALTWLYLDTRDVERVAALSWSILLVVLPSVVLFAVLPLLLARGVAFSAALPLACTSLVAAYAAYAVVLRRLGVEL